MLDSFENFENEQYLHALLYVVTNWFGQLLVVVSTGRELSSKECASLVPFAQASTLFLPLR